MSVISHNSFSLDGQSRQRESCTLQPSSQQSSSHFFILAHTNSPGIAPPKFSVHVFPQPSALNRELRELREQRILFFPFSGGSHISRLVLFPFALNRKQRICKWTSVGYPAAMSTVQEIEAALLSIRLFLSLQARRIEAVARR